MEHFRVDAAVMHGHQLQMSSRVTGTRTQQLEELGTEFSSDMFGPTDTMPTCRVECLNQCAKHISQLVITH